MRYRIEANMYGMKTDAIDLETFYADNRNDAVTLFNFLLRSGIRPIRLIDTEGEHSTMKAENGLRTGC